MANYAVYYQWTMKIINWKLFEIYSESYTHCFWWMPTATMAFEDSNQFIHALHQSRGVETTAFEFNHSTISVQLRLIWQCFFLIFCFFFKFQLIQISKEMEFHLVIECCFCFKFCQKLPVWFNWSILLNKHYLNDNNSINGNNEKT